MIDLGRHLLHSFYDIWKLCPMYRHLMWLPVTRRFNFTINSFDFRIKKLGEIDLNSEIYIWVIIDE